MLFVVIFIAVLSAAYFYCQALKCGLGLKRWALAGLMFGPLVWPMFCMKKRMKVNKLFGFDGVIYLV